MKSFSILTIQPPKKELVMGLLLPRISFTGCDRAESLLRNHSTNIVGTFWLMNGRGFDEPNIPNWWERDIGS
jgi:hypothetical protein